MILNVGEEQAGDDERATGQRGRESNWRAWPFATRVLATAAILLAIVGALSISAVGLFSAGAPAGANTFTTGTVIISTSPTNALITYGSMMPGNQVTRPVTVTNAGALDLRYAVTSTTTENVLAAQLELTAKSGVVNCTNAGFGATGQVLYGPGDLGSTGGTNLIGNPAQGAHSGDRTLAPGASEVLCLNVILPAGTGYSYENLSTVATLSFLAEQTRNN